MSISQAGVYSLKLYENKDFEFDYDSNGLIILSSISNTGDTLELETNDNFIKYANALVPAENNTTLNDHTLAFEINGLDQSNLDIIEKLQSSIYGWIALITFMDNQVYLINIPFHPKYDKFDSQVTHTFFVELKPRIFTLEKLEEVVEASEVNVPVPNGGASGTTDWINTTDGLAEFWNITNGTASIITGGGFSGNAQRLDAEDTYNFDCDPFSITPGQSYKLRFKYRSSRPQVNTAVLILNDFIVLSEITTNTSTPAIYESDAFSSVNTTIYILIQLGDTGSPDYLEIDEVELIEQ